MCIFYWKTGSSVTFSNGSVNEKIKGVNIEIRNIIMENSNMLPIYDVDVQWSSSNSSGEKKCICGFYLL